MKVKIIVAGSNGFVPQHPIRQQSDYNSAPTNYQQPKNYAPKNNFNKKHRSSVAPLNVENVKMNLNQDLGKTYTRQLIWALINAIVFFPLLVWIPGLVWAFKARSTHKHKNYIDSNKYVKSAYSFNIYATTIGVIVVTLALAGLAIGLVVTTTTDKHILNM